MQAALNSLRAAADPKGVGVPPPAALPPIHPLSMQAAALEHVLAAAEAARSTERGRRLEEGAAQPPPLAPVDLPERPVEETSAGLRLQCTADRLRRRDPTLAAVHGPVHVAPPGTVQLRGEAAAWLGSAWVGNPCLTEVRLGGLGLRDADGAALVRGLGGCAALATLDLGDNALGAGTAAALAALLPGGGLRELLLRCNVLGDAGVASLAKGVGRSRLLALDLARNELSDASVLVAPVGGGWRLWPTAARTAGGSAGRGSPRGGIDAAAAGARGQPARGARGEGVVRGGAASGTGSDHQAD